MSNTVQETLFEIQKEDARVKSYRLTSPTVLDAGNEGRRRRAKLMENEECAGLTTEHTFRPIISKSLPDYKKLQDNFTNKLEKKKSSRPPTVPLPFRMVQIHQEEGRSQKIQRQKEILKEEKEQIEKAKLTRVPYYNSIIPPSMMVDVIEYYVNDSNPQKPKHGN